MLQEVMQERDFAEGENTPLSKGDHYLLFTVIQEYDRFLAYIVEMDLEDVCELKPIVNGGDIMKSLGAQKGPWMSRATTMVIEWQLLRPDTTQELALEMLSSRRAELGL